MAFTPHELKNAAIKAHADLPVRVTGAPGGVATFFDNLFGQLLYRLVTTEATYGWDAHVNVHDVLVHMDGFLAQGDYLFVEDSRIKTRELGAFLAQREQRYRVDTRYTDFFGRNATCAANSFFLRT